MKLVFVYFVPKIRMADGRINTLYNIFLIYVLIPECAEYSQDQTSMRPNTIFDDPDDIQRQLDNEAKDRNKFGRPKTIWVFHFPTQYPQFNSFGETIRPTRALVFHKGEEATANIRSFLTDANIEEERRFESAIRINMFDAKTTTNLVGPVQDWDYKDQNKWVKMFPQCGGRSQSPVDLPMHGLIKARGARKLLFCNYEVKPTILQVMNDGNRVILFGEWGHAQQPLIYGGAAHSRRYLFHSMTLHWPSEHLIGGLQYPLESQALHISAEYSTLEEAVRASAKDPQSMLGIVNIYKFGETSQKGIKEIIQLVLGLHYNNGTLPVKPLNYFNPPFKEYVCYQGSMTTPPCTETVLWLIRARALSISRNALEVLRNLPDLNGDPRRTEFRQVQPLNDRRIFMFH